MTTKPWKFRDAPNTVVISEKRLGQKGSWIACVTHDVEDGMWQFITNGTLELSLDQALVLSLGEIVAIDPSVNDVADLPLGWRAVRSTPESSWERTVTRP
jgi:hypothetical protein